ncbi:hypothetical protein BESB_014870 [Besnoitia besnoiti]|uniref:Uncharacterized protein n=1 Tax=Besnoitia besnoiti TaxID=94643 RepID=A0A2A9M6Q6_BESBE|nr:hypothetical protein BESB_014870 [Besnoitia besnoiti]PFH32874.1 hypothetical protein BESB_014870 [Besnoitia besnoiti]
MLHITGLKRLLPLLSLVFVFEGSWRIVADALALRAASRAEKTLAAPAPSAMTPLTDGQVVEMSAAAFRSVRAWCSAYQAQWQTNNQMCLNRELGEAFRQAAALGPNGLFDFRTYTGLEIKQTAEASGTNAPVQAVNDPNSPTHAAKYIYGTVCTGELNYACKKILEANVSTDMTDNIGVPSSEEVEKILAHFDKQTPLEAAASAEAEEKMLPAPSSDEVESSNGAESTSAGTTPTSTPAGAQADETAEGLAAGEMSEENGAKEQGATVEADDDLIAGAVVDDEENPAASTDSDPLAFSDEAGDDDDQGVQYADEKESSSASDSQGEPFEASEEDGSSAAQSDGQAAPAAAPAVAPSPQAAAAAAAPDTQDMPDVAAAGGNSAAAEPQGAAAEPQGAAAEPQGAAAEPQGAAAEPQGAATDAVADAQTATFPLGVAP